MPSKYELSPLGLVMLNYVCFLPVSLHILVEKRASDFIVFLDLPQYFDRRFELISYDPFSFDKEIHSLH